MTTYQELLAQRDALDKQIQQSRQKAQSEALDKVLALVSEFGFTAQQVFPYRPVAQKAARAPVAAKYRDPATGKTWTGRGKAPAWIADKDRSKYAI
jgi:DNA-binding protein H-NS